MKTTKWQKTETPTPSRHLPIHGDELPYGCCT